MRRVLIAIVLLILLLSAVPVYAAEPEVPGGMDVQLWPGAQAGETVVVIASITLTETVSLPATVQFPIPEGMKVDWAGEIIGTDASQDIQRQPEIKTGENGQYAEFELSESRVAQVEFSGGAVQASGQNLVTSFNWTQTVGSGVVGFSVRLPAGATVVGMNPQPAGTPQRNNVGETLYTLPSADLKTGETEAISVTYTMQGSPAGGAARTGAGSGTTVLWLLGAALVAAAAALVWAVRRQQVPAVSEPVTATRAERPARQRPAPEEPADDEDAFRFDE